MNKSKLLYAGAGLLVFAAISTGIFLKISGGNSDAASQVASVTSAISISLETVGVSDITGIDQVGSSWPGEIISLNNLQVQPDREGTISQWYVRIGERVKAGQVIGRLSRPPQTPEMISMLSEKSQMLSEARTSADALRIYTTKRILQLQQLRIDTENSNKQKIDLLRSDISGDDNTLLSLIASKKTLAQVILRGSIMDTFPVMYGQTRIPPLELIFSVQPKSMFGAIDSSLRNKLSGVLSEALSDLKDVHIVPEKSGLLYFDTAIKLANASVADPETLSEASLESLKQMLIEDQSEFVIVLGEIKSMELERVNTQREFIDTLAEIDAMIIELEKELAILEGEVKAKEIAYEAIRGSITGGYGIVAPKSGVVSSIMKKPGEFVGPGMPVAIVTTGGNDSVLVRIRMPSNIQKPAIGGLLSIIRPGFGTDVQKVRLVGIGSSLDDGSYMADAVFTEATQWPIGASVRILQPASSSAVLIKYSSFFWDEGGIPAVWAISEADRIFAKKITIGRTLGDFIEVYAGLKNGDRYIANPSLEIKENMFLGDLVKIPAPKENNTSVPAESGGHEEMDMGH